MRSRKLKIRQEFPLDLEEAIEWYGFDYVYGIYKQTLEDLT